MTEMRTAGIVMIAAVLVACGGMDEPTVLDGGAATDGGPAVACTDDGGTRFAKAARACSSVEDCTVSIGQTCCTQSAYGIAKAAVAVYGACFHIDVSKCMTGCASPNWYWTDTGAVTAAAPYGTDPSTLVTLDCVKGLCTTDAVVVDAGRD